MPTHIRGLLMINSKGDKYFIEGGIKANRHPDNLGDVRIDITYHNELADLETRARGAWFESIEETEADSPNLGPFMFQAFNVIIEVPDDGSDAFTASSVDVSHNA